MNTDEKERSEITAPTPVKKTRRERAKAAAIKYFKNFLDIRDDMMSYEEIDEMMLENTIIHGPNMWILMLAILIASIGLNVNSTAVIIGAMLISPLMSGIMTMGYSLAVRDLSLLKRALQRFGTQVLISLVTSTVYFLITPLSSPTAEMIARTEPTLWDVMIALFGGIAGMIGNTRKKKSNVIPGVAIATALMPPLCTAGYGIATLQAGFFFGAFYLFLINTLFISLSTAFVTVLLRVPYHKNLSEKRQKNINHAIAAITVIMIVPSVFFAAGTVYKSVMNNNVSRFISEQFVFPETQVVKSSADNTSKIISVSLVGTPVSDDVLSVLEQELNGYGLNGYKLRVTQNAVQQGVTEEQLSDILGEAQQDAADKITIYMLEQSINELNEKIADYEKTVSDLTGEVEEYREKENSWIDTYSLAEEAAQIFDNLYNVRCGIVTEGSENTAVVIAESDRELSEAEKETVKNWLTVRTGLNSAEVYITVYSETYETAETVVTEEPDETYE